VAFEDPRQAMQRQMTRLFADDDVSQESRFCQTLLDGDSGNSAATICGPVSAAACSQAVQA
jgi:hypothetical protein